MPKTAVYNVEGQTVGEIELADEVFASSVNEDLMHAAVLMYLANQRVGTAATKTRGMVSGGGRKPWRQKGTGRARQGSIRAPHWKGGGTVFGPQPRDYRQSMPKRARRKALCSALTCKVQDGELRVLDSLKIDEPKTKTVVNMLQALDTKGKALLVTGDHDTNVYLSARNIPGVKTTAASDLNVYDVLNHQNLIMTRDAVARIEEVLGS